MYKVSLTKACGCVKKANMPISKEFNSKEDAENEAKAWAEKMNKTFCKKHNFVVTNLDSNEILIEVGMN